LTARRFPPPWSVEDVDAAFVVKDSAKQKLAYVYFEDERAADQRPSCSAKTRLRRIAANVAKLPELLRNA
jgi:hypothetical protein